MTMRRSLAMIFILIVAVSCAGIPVSVYKPAPTQTETPLPTITSTIQPSQTPIIVPSFTPTFPLSTFTPALTATPSPYPGGFEVLYHPDDVLYVGDQVSFEVISPQGWILMDLVFVCRSTLLAVQALVQRTSAHGGFKVVPKLR